VEFDTPNVDELVKSAFSSLICCGSTPTATTLEVAKSYLDTVISETNLYTILATDGAPNCNRSLDSATCTCTGDDPDQCAEDENSNLCLDDQATYDAAKALFDGGFPTYVVGYNVPARWEEVMNTVAENGGTEEYFPVEDTTELEKALEEISGEIASCEFEVDWDSLDGNNVSEDKSLVNFYCKEDASDPIGPDNLVKYDKGCKDNSGWTWLDDNTVEFCEEACEALKKGECTVVVATFGCETIIE
jgi:hypothetical protein